MKKVALAIVVAVVGYGASKDNALALRADLWKKMHPNKKVLREEVEIGDAGLSADLAKKLIGKSAEIDYTWNGSSFHEFLYFEDYDSQYHAVIGERITEYGASDLLMCGTSPDPRYIYLCLSSYDEENADWYFFNLYNEELSGVYIFGSPDDAEYFLTNGYAEPLNGRIVAYTSSSASSYNPETILPPTPENESSNSAFFSSSISSDNSNFECAPGQEYCTSSSENGYGDNSGYSSSTCNDFIDFGTLQTYEMGEELPGRQVVYTKEVVDQIVEHKLQQCRQDPRSCGIDALPIIRMTSDPYAIYNQIKDRALPIKGYYLHYGSDTYDWIYVPYSLSSAYKLEKGVDEQYRLRWTPLPSEIVILKNGDSIIFH